MVPVSHVCGVKVRVGRSGKERVEEWKDQEGTHWERGKWISQQAVGGGGQWCLVEVWRGEGEGEECVGREGETCRKETIQWKATQKSN